MIRLLVRAVPRLRPLLLAVLAGVVSDLAALALLATAAWLIVRAAQHPPLAALTVAIVAVRALALGRGVFRYAERLAGHDAALRASAALREQVYAALVRVGPSATATFRRGDLLSRLVADVDTVQDLLLRCLFPAVVAAVVGGSAVGFVAALLPAAGWLLAVGLLAAGVAVPVATAVGSRRVGSGTAAARAELSARTVDVVSGAAELAAYGAADAASAKAERAGARLARLERRGGAVVAAASATTVLVQGLTAVAVTAVASSAAASGRLSAVVPAVLALVALVSFEVMTPLPGAARLLIETRAAARRVLDIVDARSEAAEPDGPASSPDAPYAMELAGVRVRYGDADLTGGGSEGGGTNAAVDRMDLRLPPGRRVALVGPSGSGKSTVLAAALGLVHPESGRATLNGVDLRAVGDDDLRRVLRGVTQGEHVFHASVAANLRLARPDADDAEMAEALRRARLLEWVECLPGGWDTVVGEDGAAMSGGQRQRLLLARAFLADPPVLLLDEPTESLDPEIADDLLADLLAQTEGRTTLLVTHRLAGLSAVDEVVVLDEGRVVQRGHHDDLIGRPGWYRDTWLSEQFTARL